MIFLIALGFAFLGKIIGKSIDSQSTPTLHIGIMNPSPPQKYRAYLEPAIISLKRGTPISDSEIGMIFEKAYSKEDWSALAWLTDNFGIDTDNWAQDLDDGEDDGEDIEDENEGEEDEGDCMDDEDEEEEELEEEVPEEDSDDTDEMLPVDIGRPAEKSPLEGIEDDDWSNFLSAIRTREVGWSGPKHVGQFEQNRTRIQALGIPLPHDAKSEEEAIASDIQRYRDEQFQMVADWSGDVVTIDSEEVPITQSGIFGLLKAAGPKGAQEWLTNPEDRKKFPQTTQIFLKTNGLF